EDKPKNLDSFVDHGALKWSRNLKRHFTSGDVPKFSLSNLRRLLYRPYTQVCLYHSDVLVDEPAHTAEYVRESSEHNRLLCFTGPGSDKPFCSLAANLPADLHLVSPGCTTQCFPFYIYAEDGSNRRENITDWALEQFRSHYGDPSITKWDIFHYVYAVLHHPAYRQRYAANLRRELPRIPFVGNSLGNDEAPNFSSRSRGAPAENSRTQVRGSRDKRFFRSAEGRCRRAQLGGNTSISRLCK